MGWFNHQPVVVAQRYCPKNPPGIQSPTSHQSTSKTSTETAQNSDFFQNLHPKKNMFFGKAGGGPHLLHMGTKFQGDRMMI